MTVLAGLIEAAFLRVFVALLAVLVLISLPDGRRAGTRGAAGLIATACSGRRRSSRANGLPTASGGTACGARRPATRGTLRGWSAADHLPAEHGVQHWRVSSTRCRCLFGMSEPSRDRSITPSAEPSGVRPSRHHSA